MTGFYLIDYDSGSNLGRWTGRVRRLEAKKLFSIYKNVFVVSNLQHRYRQYCRRHNSSVQIGTLCVWKISSSMVERRNDYQIRVKTTQLIIKGFKERFTDVLQSLKPIYSVDFGEKICSPRDLLDLLDGNCNTQF